MNIVKAYSYSTSHYGFYYFRMINNIPCRKQWLYRQAIQFWVENILPDFMSLIIYGNTRSLLIIIFNMITVQVCNLVKMP